MKIVKYLIFLLCLVENIALLGQIRILLSAALVDRYADFRMQQYIECLNILISFGYKDPYVVEAVKKVGPTFLENYSKNVFYATKNNPQLRSQGINEAITLLEGTHFFNFDPEDMIIKLTGRYQFISNYFLEFVKNHPEYDAIVKVRFDGVYVLCFAMRCKYFQEMYQNMDYNTIELYQMDIEHMVGEYIKKKVQEGKLKVLYIDKLDVKANLLGSTTQPSYGYEIKYF